MNRILLLGTAALAALTISVNARNDRLPTKFVGNWCLAEHTADHLSFYRRGRCTNPARVDDWLTISPDGFDAHEMHCKVLVLTRTNAATISLSLVRRQSDSKLLVLA